MDTGKINSIVEDGFKQIGRMFVQNTLEKTNTKNAYIPGDLLDKIGNLEEQKIAKDSELLEKLSEIFAVARTLIRDHSAKLKLIDKSIGENLEREAWKFGGSYVNNGKQ